MNDSFDRRGFRLKIVILLLVMVMVATAGFVAGRLSSDDGSTAGGDSSPGPRGATTSTRPSPSPSPQPGATTSFTFGAAGDFGQTDKTAALLRAVGAPATRPDFFIALGDLKYRRGTENDWCELVKSSISAGSGSDIGDRYPFQLVAGDHETTDDEGDGDIKNFARCLPDRLGSVSSELDSKGAAAPDRDNYGLEYYFDYPRRNPIARFIFQIPELTPYNDGKWVYNQARAAWLSRSIDSARAQGIRWIIVANHWNYLPTANKESEFGPLFFDTVIRKKVDILLQGHDHSYVRSKQIRHGPGCPSVPPTFEPACVVPGSSDELTQGNGTVLVMPSAGGVGVRKASPTGRDSYFALSSPGPYGFSRFTVSDTEIRHSYVNTSGGSLEDDFVIRASLPPERGSG